MYKKTSPLSREVIKYLIGCNGSIMLRSCSAFCAQEFDQFVIDVVIRSTYFHLGQKIKTNKLLEIFGDAFDVLLQEECRQGRCGRVIPRKAKEYRKCNNL